MKQSVNKCTNNKVVKEVHITHPGSQIKRERKE